MIFCTHLCTYPRAPNRGEFERTTPCFLVWRETSQSGTGPGLPCRKAAGDWSRDSAVSVKGIQEALRAARAPPLSELAPPLAEGQGAGWSAPSLRKGSVDVEFRSRVDSGPPPQPPPTGETRGNMQRRRSLRNPRSRGQADCWGALSASSPRGSAE